MSSQDDTTARSNHPFIIKIDYLFASPYHHFCDTRETAEAIVRMIVSAIEKEQRMIALDVDCYITIESIRSIRVIEKGTQYDDLKWLG